MKQFQNVRFWNCNLRFKGKSGLLTAFSKSRAKTNRVLEPAQIIVFLLLKKEQRIFNRDGSVVDGVLPDL
jgi:hypothetical protein